MPTIESHLLLVEKSGVEMPLTLLVQGQFISGHLTAWANYTRWAKEVMMRTAITGSESLTRVPPPSPEIAAQQARDFKARHAEAKDADSVAAPVFALRNARAENGPGLMWKRFPYLVIVTAHVSALSLGISGPDEDEPEVFPPAG